MVTVMDLDYRYSTIWAPHYLRRLLKCWDWRSFVCARPMKNCWTCFNDDTGEGIMIIGTTNQVEAQKAMKRFAVGYGKIEDKRIDRAANLNR